MSETAPEPLYWLTDAGWEAARAAERALAASETTTTTTGAPTP